MSKNDPSDELSDLLDSHPNSKLKIVCPEVELEEISDISYDPELDLIVIQVEVVGDGR